MVFCFLAAYMRVNQYQLVCRREGQQQSRHPVLLVINSPLLWLGCSVPVLFELHYCRWTVTDINKHWWNAAKRGQVVRRVPPELFLNGDPPLFLDFFEMMHIHRDNMSRDQNPLFPLAFLFWVVVIGSAVAVAFDLIAAWLVSVFLWCLRASAVRACACLGWPIATAFND